MTTANANAKRPGVGYIPANNSPVAWIEQMPDGRLRERTTAFRFNGADPNLLNNKSHFEDRYGAGTFSRKKFKAADNELFSPVALALQHAFSKGRLGSPDVYDGNPTKLEVTDAFATGSCINFVRTYWKEADLPGVRHDNPIKAVDTSRAENELWTQNDPYWGIRLWYQNTAKNKPGEPEKPIEKPTVPAPSPVDNNLSKVSVRTRELKEHVENLWSVIRPATTLKQQRYGDAILANPLLSIAIKAIVQLKRRALGQDLS